MLVVVMTYSAYCHQCCLVLTFIS